MSIGMGDQRDQICSFPQYSALIMICSTDDCNDWHRLQWSVGWL